MAILQDLIHLFELMPHPEGGFFKETYRAEENISQSALPERFSGNRSFSTAIFYLLGQGDRSRLHRIQADEVWHFYLGGPLVVAGIDLKGEPFEITLGQDVNAGQQLQCTVYAGQWFGAFPAPGTEFSFVGCTVAPGFDFADFELGNQQQLLADYPQAQAIIQRLT